LITSHTFPVVADSHRHPPALERRHAHEKRVLKQKQPLE